MKDDSNLVIDIMRSISPYYDDIDIEFIRKYALEKGREMLSGGHVL